ncbi:lipoyl(octanoyl) transferase LipB [Buchnera aphidicola]|uniref:lipoyl(octanoyl) transferase LipB n=1 Tax=Buchnera aphidicola TaxID=9 RepID=UPI003464A4C9
MYNNSIIVRDLGLQHWKIVSDLMQAFTTIRTVETLDELWCVEHYPIFTLGSLGTRKDIIKPVKIPIMHTNRGGKITYHGPGQQIIYLLLDLKRRNISVRNIISLIENSVVDTLNYFFIKSHIMHEYPGVFVKNKKICSFGLRIKKGCSLHGFSLNVCMDMRPFSYIYPCGNKKINMTQIYDFKKNINCTTIKLVLIKKIVNFLKISSIFYK